MLLENGRCVCKHRYTCITIGGRDLGSVGSQFDGRDAEDARLRVWTVCWRNVP